MNILTKKQIKEYFEDGWRFSVKKTGKYRYIRCRKRDNKDVNMGKYSEETWTLIQSIQNKKTAVEKIDLNEALSHLLEWRHQMITKSCQYPQQRYCVYWKIPDKIVTVEDFRDEVSEIYGAPVLSPDLEGYWYFKAVPEWCASCPAYKPKD